MQSNNAVHHASGVVMGGPWQLRHVVKPDIDPAQVAQAALAALQAVDRQMSHYKTDSDLMRLNRAPPGQWVEVAADMVTVMAAAADIGDFTAGALNISLGQAINAWGFGPEPVPLQCPDTQSWTAVRHDAAYAWRTQPPAVRRLADVAFNLAALAKGFAVDRAAQAVRALGITDFIVEAAGEVYAQGLRNGVPWQVGLELPVPKRCLVYGQIALCDMAVATSGGYRKYHQIGDRQAIHTLDPGTAMPIDSDLLAVTVLDRQCMRADALATALFVQGAAAGSAFADKQALAALFLLRTDDGICEIRSQAWMDYLAATGQTSS